MQSPWKVEKYLNVWLTSGIYLHLLENYLSNVTQTLEDLLDCSKVFFQKIKELKHHWLRSIKIERSFRKPRAGENSNYSKFGTNFDFKSAKQNSVPRTNVNQFFCEHDSFTADSILISFVTMYSCFKFGPKVCKAIGVHFISSSNINFDYLRYLEHIEVELK